MSRIIIFGTGRGANVATRYFRDDSPYEVVAYTVDDAYADATEYSGCPVIPFSRIETEIPPAESEMFIALGFQRMNAFRAEKVEEARGKGYSLASYVSSRVMATEGQKFGENCFILPGNVFDHDVTIGNDVVMWSANHVGDLSVIEDHAWLASHVVLSGDVTIGANAFLGVNATISNHVHVGARSFIGAGAVIAQDTAPDSVYVEASTRELEQIDSLRFVQMIRT